MKTTKRSKLEGAGWKFGSASDFLELSPEEEMIVSMRVALAASLKDRRKRLKLTQQQLATQIGSSQSRVARMESADSSVSLDLLVRALAVMGLSQKDIGRLISTSAA